MSTVWLTFRLDARKIGSRNYDERREALYEAIAKHASKWWLDPTSFVVFESSDHVETIAASCERAIAPTYDMFLIREMDTKTAVICGKVKNKEIFDLIPYLKELA